MLTRVAIDGNPLATSGQGGIATATATGDPRSAFSGRGCDVLAVTDSGDALKVHRRAVRLGRKSMRLPEGVWERLTLG